jgi:ribosome-binding protein aMBF1 (putative translation factor)
LEGKEMHLVKKVSKELGLTYKELGEKIGYSESNLRRSVSKNQLSGQLKKAIELYLEIVKLKENEEKNRKSKALIATYSKKILYEIDPKRYKNNKILDK